MISFNRQFDFFRQLIKKYKYKKGAFLLDLRNSEKLKIHCGNAHFKALEDNIKFFKEPVKDWDELKVNI